MASAFKRMKYSVVFDIMTRMTRHAMSSILIMLIYDGIKSPYIVVIVNKFSTETTNLLEKMQQIQIRR